MDLSFKITYSIQTLYSLNKKNIYTINSELINFFNTFPKNKYINTPYRNPLNINFKEQTRKKLFPTIEAFSDEKIISELRSILIKLTPENKKIILKQLYKIRISPTCLDKVVELLHQITIDCIFLVETYVDIFLNVEQWNKTMIDKLYERIIKQFYHPIKFSTKFDNIACETAEQKEKRWKINNAIIIAEFFRKNKINHQFMINKIFIPLINGIKQGNLLNIEILHKILMSIKPQLTQKNQVNLSDLLNQIEKLSKEQTYQHRLRFLLMDIIELYKK